MNAIDSLDKDGFVVGSYTGIGEQLWFILLPNSQFCWECTKFSILRRLSKLPLFCRLFQWINRRTIESLGFTPTIVVIKRNDEDHETSPRRM